MSTVREFRVHTKPKLSAEEKKAAEEKRQKQRKEDSEIVKGIFTNLEAPGTSVELSIRLYKEDPVRCYTLEDGEEYTIPLGVAKHINRQCKYKKSKHLIDPKTGRNIVGADKPIQRYSFISVDYQ